MVNYEERDGLKYMMEQRWHAGAKEQFPSDLKDCIEKFKQIEAVLDSEYHLYVNLGAAVNNTGLLTDHGPDHVQMVMRRALQIVGEKRAELLNGYEMFLLLLAIHFHDLGNIFGREEHEQKIIDVMDKMGNVLPLNIIDREFVREIAMVHGGYADEERTDKDTIRALKTVELRDSIPVRPSVLAAILRFADELADDFSRAGKIGIPPENEIFHAYSSALETNIQGDTVSLRYRIPYEHTQRKMKKGGNDIYLYDEIRNRLEKCLCELEYCRKYSDGFIGITTISVTIGVICGRKTEPVDTFRLRLLGYPNNFILNSLIERTDQDGILLTDQTLKYETGEDLMRNIKERSAT